METSADICRLGFICHHNAGGHFTPISDLREWRGRPAILPHPLISGAKHRTVRCEDKSPDDCWRKIFNSSSFAANARIPDRPARRLPAVLCDHGILRVTRPGNGRRGTILVFPDHLNIVEGWDVLRRSSIPTRQIALSNIFRQM